MTSETPAEQMGRWLDEEFLYQIQGIFLMTPEEAALSEEREKRWEIAFNEYRNRMREKYGLDGGPSPAIVFGEPFYFEG